MLRGVNKQIIEINDTENLFFEKAVLYVRPEYAELSGAKLKDNANEYLQELANKKKTDIGNSFKNNNIKRTTSICKKNIIAALIFTLAVATGALILLIKLS